MLPSLRHLNTCFAIAHQISRFPLHLAVHLTNDAHWRSSSGFQHGFQLAQTHEHAVLWRISCKTVFHRLLLLIQVIDSSFTSPATRRRCCLHESWSRVPVMSRNVSVEASLSKQADCKN